MASPLEFVTRAEAESGKLFGLHSPVVRDLFRSRDPMVLVCGVVGSGKTRAVLEKIYACCLKYPKSRWLISRATRRSLTEAALVTWEEEVISPAHLSPDRIRREGRSSYRFKNGSTVVVAGLDDPVKVRSTQYDGAYIQEATEITREAAQEVATRLRNGRMPYQQLLMDCNPSSPKHWLKLDTDSGRFRRLDMRHSDNPAYYDPVRKEWTPRGKNYVALLNATLTGTKKLQLLDGLWAQAEGVVYDGWDVTRHLVPNEYDPGPPHPIPAHWRRYWAIDFGFTNPTSWQWWAEDADGRLYLYRQIYQTGRLIKDLAERVVQLSEGEPRPRAVICDHDPEAIAQIERITKIRCTPADKVDRKGGIQQVADRLRIAADGKPRLFVLRDSLAHSPDPKLVAAAKPTDLQSEMDSYVYDPRLTRGEEPLKENDHANDALRYLARFLDGKPKAVADPYAVDRTPPTANLPDGTFTEMGRGVFG